MAAEKQFLLLEQYAPTNPLPKEVTVEATLEEDGPDWRVRLRVEVRGGVTQAGTMAYAKEDHTRDGVEAKAFKSLVGWLAEMLADARCENEIMRQALAESLPEPVSPPR